MTTKPRTYTTAEVQALLKFPLRAAVHEYAKRYPDAFVRVHKGAGTDPTLWDADKIDAFLTWRQDRSRYARATSNPKTPKDRSHE